MSSKPVGGFRTHIQESYLAMAFRRRFQWQRHNLKSTHSDFKQDCPRVNLFLVDNSKQYHFNRTVFSTVSNTSNEFFDLTASPYSRVKGGLPRLKAAIPRVGKQLGLVAKMLCFNHWTFTRTALLEGNHWLQPISSSISTKTTTLLRNWILSFLL